MTYITTCLNCGSDSFIYDPQDYQMVRLHPNGGIAPASEIPNWERGEDSRPEQVTCAGCGLEVERERLDPDLDPERSDEMARLSDFKIKHHG